MRVQAVVQRYGWWEVFRFAWQLPRLTRLLARLVGDSRVSRAAKGLLLAGVSYALSPFDFLSDLVPFLGQLDDLALLALVLRTFLNLCPPEVVEEHAALAA